MKQQDAVVQKLKEKIALRMQRNAQAPISRLPPEVMGNIFLFCKEKSFFRPHTLRWIKVSHVCTLWRKIAIDFAELWCDPQFWNKRWAEEAIKRAKGTSLAITLDFDTAEKSLDLVAQIWPSRAEHFKQLRVENSPGRAAQWDWFWEAAPSSLARLEKLDLNNCKVAAGPPTPLFSFPGAHNLREINIHYCTVDWTGVRLPSSLEILSLRDVYPSSPATDLHLFNSLEGLQSLETLEMLNFLENFEIDYSHIHHAEFPKLQKFNINSSAHATAFFFRSVTFPSNIHLNAGIRDESTSVETLKDMFTAIGQSFHYGPHDPQPPGLYFVSNPDSCGLILFYEGRARPGDRSKTTLIDITIYWASLRLSLESTVFAIFQSALPLQDVSDARISWSTSFSPSILAETFGRLPSLSSLSLIRSEVPGFAEAIGLPNSGSTGMYFMNLSTIVLVQHNYKSNPFLSALQESLLRRRVHHCPDITKLELNACFNVDNNVLDQLREIVVDVIESPLNS